MCLSNVTPISYSVENGYVKAWKVISRSLATDCFNYPLKLGVNVNVPFSGKRIKAEDAKEYTAGFHCFVEKKDAIRWLDDWENNEYFMMIEVFIKPEHILATGFQHIRDTLTRTVPAIVCSVLEIRSWEAD